jgi:hypothetical protein
VLSISGVVLHFLLILGKEKIIMFKVMILFCLSAASFYLLSKVRPTPKRRCRAMFNRTRDAINAADDISDECKAKLLAENERCLNRILEIPWLNHY